MTPFSLSLFGEGHDIYFLSPVIVNILDSARARYSSSGNGAQAQGVRTVRYIFRNTRCSSSPTYERCRGCTRCVPHVRRHSIRFALSRDDLVLRACVLRATRILPREAVRRTATCRFEIQLDNAITRVRGAELFIIHRADVQLEACTSVISIFKVLRCVIHSTLKI